MKLYSEFSKREEKNDNINLHDKDEISNYSSYNAALKTINWDLIDSVKEVPQLYQQILILCYFRGLPEQGLRLIEETVRKHARNIARGPVSLSTYKFVEEMVIKKSLPKSLKELKQVESTEEKDVVYSVSNNYEKVLMYEDAFVIPRKEIPIVSICNDYLFELLLLETLKVLGELAPAQNTRRLFEPTTANRHSVLSLYLQQNWPRYQSMGKPTLTLDKILVFLESLSMMKLKSKNPSLALTSILVLNIKLLETENFSFLFDKFWIVKTITDIQDPTLSVVFLQLSVSLDLSMGKDERAEDKLKQCRRLVLLGFTSKLYKFIADFDILMGYLSMFSRGWNIIKDEDTVQQSLLRDLFREYEKSKGNALVDTRNSEVKEIEEIHGFKFNFLKMLVKNHRFEAMYRSYCTPPSEWVKKELSDLVIHL